MRNFVIRAVVGVVFVAVMVGAIVWRADSMILLFAIITGLSIWEFCGLVNQIDDVQTNRFISTVAGVYFFLAVAALQTGLASNFVVFVPYVLTMLYLLVSELYLKQPNPISDWAYTFLSQMYVAMPLSLINMLAFQTSADGNPYYNWLLPLSLFVFLWANDTGAYCVGSLLGRHKLFPRVSPGKSWEGAHQPPPAFHHPSALMDRTRTGGGGLRHLGRPRGEPLQAHPRHQGQRQHPARPRRNVGPLRLLAPGYPCRSGLPLYAYADLVTPNPPHHV